MTNSKILKSDTKCVFFASRILTQKANFISPLCVFSMVYISPHIDEKTLKSKHVFKITLFEV